MITMSICGVSEPAKACIPTALRKSSLFENFSGFVSCTYAWAPMARAAMAIRSPTAPAPRTRTDWPGDAPDASSALRVQARGSARQARRPGREGGMGIRQDSGTVT